MQGKLNSIHPSYYYTNKFRIVLALFVLAFVNLYGQNNSTFSPEEYVLLLKNYKID